MSKKLIYFTSFVMILSPAVLGNIIVDDNFDDGAIGTNNTGIGTGFNTVSLTGGSVTESDSSANLINTVNGAARAGIASKEGAVIGGKIARFEFIGVSFARNTANTGTGTTGRTAVGVRGDSTAEDVDGGVATGFWIQFESGDIGETNASWSGTSTLFYESSAGVKTVLATWEYNTLNWDDNNAATMDFTPVLDITLDLGPNGYTLTIEGDTISNVTGSLSGTYASAGITNELTMGYAFAFNQGEAPGLNMSIDEIVIMEGVPAPVFAALPNPEDGGKDIIRDVILSWTPGEFAETHNLFFGNDFNDVNNATETNLLNTTYVEGLDVNSYDIGSLEFGMTYYWRIDEVNAPSKPGKYKGIVWSFTVEPIAYKLPADKITVTAISSTKGNDPINTINEAGLDPNTEQHTNGSGSWASSGTDTNDVWIRYDFDKTYKLYEMLVWNYNHTLLWRYGFKDVLIEYSEDGQTWTQLTTVTQFDRASGKPDYVYNTVVPFNGAAAKSVRITALSNWGTYKNSGLSEVRFNYIPVRARQATPETGATDVSVNTTLSWRPGREAVSHNVYITTSEEAIEDGSAPVHTVTVNSYVPSLNVGQTYYWRVDEVNNSETPSVWQSDIWSFITQEYITIDDFEDYNNSSGYEIWGTWIDGYGIDENGSQMGHTNSPFAETTIVEHGRQSAPVYYDNTTAQANYSQVTRTFDSNMNWQVSGADTIRLYYHGVADQAAENLYISLEDSTGKSAKVFAPADALSTIVWTEWIIPYSQFTGVNMTKIKKISVGVGNTASPLKGTGVVYIDNIGYGHTLSQ
jgi:hypothetical protein